MRSGTGWSAAVSGGWTDSDTLVAEVAFLETPHQLAVTVRSPPVRSPPSGAPCR